MPHVPNITETRPDEERLRLIELVTQEAAGYLRLSLDGDPPDHIVKEVNDCVRNIQQGHGPSFPKDSDVDLLLGCLWGSQLVRSLDWDWANIHFNDRAESKAIGIVSPSRDLVIYPFHFVHGCIHNNATVKILLAYNLVVEARRLPTYPPRSYENLMDHVFHIVPPSM